ncbi:MAG: thiamine-phosphate kinase [Acidobacteriaceae bacterium]
MGERERALLRTIRDRAGGGGIGHGGARRGAVRVGIGDDAAVLALRPGEELVVTTDLSLEDVHFRRGWHPPEAVGHKCLARGLSDVAAMGARPVAAFVSLAVPREFSRPGRGSEGAGRSWVSRFYDGLLALAERYHVPLAGGDLAQSPGSPGPAARALADIVVIGAVPRGRALLRSGARAGDDIYVTGSLGGAAAELRELERTPRRFRNVTHADARHPHLFPEPRLEAGRALVRRRLATAAIDISDGLSVDLAHLCEESGVRAEIEGEALPRSPAAFLADALHGGDDYELLFTARPTTRVPAQIGGPIGGVAVSRIGRMLPKHRGKPMVALSEGGVLRALPAAGWQHF